MHRARAALAAAALLAVVAASLVPGSAAGGVLPSATDKLLHAAGYAAVAWAAGSALSDPDDRTLAAVALGAAALGAGVELVQPLVGRTASLLDALANCAGAALGALAARVSRTR
jgi:VanZ family protein